MVFTHIPRRPLRRMMDASCKLHCTARRNARLNSALNPP